MIKAKGRYGTPLTAPIGIIISRSVNGLNYFEYFYVQNSGLQAFGAAEK